MATTNVSDETQNFSEKVQDLYCQLHKATVIHDQLTFIAVLNAFLSITAFLGNVLVLVALRKESSLHPPSKLLFRSLAVTITDLCVGIIAEPLHVTFLVTVVNQNLNICRCVAVALSLTGRILTLESLLTLTAISVDNLIALLLVLQVITLKRTSLIIITFWVLLTVFATIMLFWSSPIASRYRTMVISLCLVTLIFYYTKIFHTLRHRQNQLRDHGEQPNQTNQLNDSERQYQQHCGCSLRLSSVIYQEEFRHTCSLTLSLLRHPFLLTVIRSHWFPYIPH